MAKQLEILALEPYCGAVRKKTLELLSRHSRHHWTIYKLPARRLERRLSTAAQWFTQQIQRLPKMRCDVLFTSDAMNLADFLRMNPKLPVKSSVAYFYANQLAGEAGADQASRLAILSTASSATEVWFGSLFHMRDFLCHAAATYQSHKELGGQQPLRSLVAKSQLLHPPVEIASPSTDADVVDAERKGRRVCLDNRDGCGTSLYVQLLSEITKRREPIGLHVLGQPLEGVPEGIPVANIDDRNDAEVASSLRRCELFISAQHPDQFDPLAMQAMALGCIPILRKGGCHGEFIPAALQSWCLYDSELSELLSRVMDLWYLRRPTVERKELDEIFERYTPSLAAENFDRRLEMLAEQSRH